MGDYEIVYPATDASGNVSRKSIVVTVVLPRIETDVARIEFGVAAADVIVDLAMQAVYYTDFEGKTLFRYDLATGITTSLVFDHMPERMFLDGTTLYVAIVMKAHSSFWFDEDQYGRIAVVDTATFALTHLFDVDTDPYGLAAYGGVLFIAPGSGQWTVLKLYDAEDGHFIGTGCFLREKSPIVLDPLTGTLYTVTVGSSPRDLERYTHDADACAESYSSPFHGDYEIGDEIFLSPDRDYIFSTAGTYFHMNPAHGEELDYAGTFGYAYLSMYFDVAADRVYIGLANGFLYVADIGAYQPYAVAEIGYPIDDVVVADGTYYIVSVDAMTTMTSLLIAVPHGG
jgi:hypothetical protein